jgi:hypothetical protein
MRDLAWASFVALLASVAAAGSAVAVQAAQSQAASRPYSPPKTADGHPDLQGLWQVLNTAAWDIQDHHARLGVPAGRGVVEGNEIPYQPWALEKKKENFAKRATLDPETKCFLPGVPRVTYMPYPFQVVQTRDKVSILHEYNHAIRHIYMNGNPHPKGPIEWWMGDSRGTWEGSTLVVDTVHFTAETWLDRAGNFHSEALHLVERFTPTGPDHIRYDVTLEDPKVFTRPWKMSMVLYRIKEPQAELLEYECHAYLLEETWPK